MVDTQNLYPRMEKSATGAHSLQVREATFKGMCKTIFCFTQVSECLQCTARLVVDANMTMAFKRLVDGHLDMEGYGLFTGR